VAADGGWDKAVALGLRPGLLVGDADSLPEARLPQNWRAGGPIERSPRPRTSRTRSWRSWPLSGGGHPRDDPGALAAGVSTRSREHRLRRSRNLELRRWSCWTSAGAPPAAPRGRSHGSARSPRYEASGLAAPARRARQGVTTSGLLYRSQRDPACGTGPRPPTSEARRGSVSLRHGHLLIVETRTNADTGATGNRRSDLNAFQPRGIPPSSSVADGRHRLSWPCWRRLELSLGVGITSGPGAASSAPDESLLTGRLAASSRPSAR